MKARKILSVFLAYLMIANQAVAATTSSSGPPRQPPNYPPTTFAGGELPDKDPKKARKVIPEPTPEELAKSQAKVNKWMAKQESIEAKREEAQRAKDAATKAQVETWMSSQRAEAARLAEQRIQAENTRLIEERSKQIAQERSPIPKNRSLVPAGERVQSTPPRQMPLQESAKAVVNSVAIGAKKISVTGVAEKVTDPVARTVGRAVKIGGSAQPPQLPGATEPPVDRAEERRQAIRNREALEKHQAANAQEMERRADQYRRSKSVPVSNGGLKEAEAKLRQLQTPTALGELAEQRANAERGTPEQRKAGTHGQDIPRGKALVPVTSAQASGSAATAAPATSAPAPSEASYETNPRRPNPQEMGQVTGRGYVNYKGEHVNIEFQGDRQAKMPTPSEVRAMRPGYMADAGRSFIDMPMRGAALVGVVGLYACSQSVLRYAHSPESCVRFFAAANDPWFYASLGSMMMVSHAVNYSFGMGHGPATSPAALRSMFVEKAPYQAPPSIIAEASLARRLVVGSIAFSAAYVVGAIGYELAKDKDVGFVMSQMFNSDRYKCIEREAKGGAACSFAEMQSEDLVKNGALDEAWKRIYQKYTNPEKLNDIDIVMASFTAAIGLSTLGSEGFKRLVFKQVAVEGGKQLIVRGPWMARLPLLTIAANPRTWTHWGIVMAGTFIAGYYLIDQGISIIKGARRKGDVALATSQFTSGLSAALEMDKSQLRSVLLQRTIVGPNGQVQLAPQRAKLESDLNAVEKMAEKYNTDVPYSGLNEQATYGKIYAETSNKRLMQAQMGQTNFLARKFLEPQQQWASHLNQMISEAMSAQRFYESFVKGALKAKQSGKKLGEYTPMLLNLGTDKSGADRLMAGPVDRSLQRRISMMSAISRGLIGWESITDVGTADLEMMVRMDIAKIEKPAIIAYGEAVAMSYRASQSPSSIINSINPETPQSIKERGVKTAALQQFTRQMVRELTGPTKPTEDVVKARGKELLNKAIDLVVSPRVAANFKAALAGTLKVENEKLISPSEIEEIAGLFSRASLFLGDNDFGPSSVPLVDRWSWGPGLVGTGHRVNGVLAFSRAELLLAQMACGETPSEETFNALSESFLGRPGFVPPLFADKRISECPIYFDGFNGILPTFRQSVGWSRVVDALPRNGPDQSIIDVLAETLPNGPARSADSIVKSRATDLLKASLNVASKRFEKEYQTILKDALVPAWSAKGAEEARSLLASEATERSGKWWWERFAQWAFRPSNMEAPTEMESMADPEILNLNFNTGVRRALLADLGLQLRTAAMTAYRLGLVPTSAIDPERSAEFKRTLMGLYELAATKPSSLAKRADYFKTFYSEVSLLLESEIATYAEEVCINPGDHTLEKCVAIAYKEALASMKFPDFKTVTGTQASEMIKSYLLNNLDRMIDPDGGDKNVDQMTYLIAQDGATGVFARLRTFLLALDQGSFIEPQKGGE